MMAERITGDRHARRFDREQWSRRANEIRTRLSVSSVIGRVVTLKKAGKEFQGICPFHNERTPSFTVSDRKGFYHCFGCGAHGDAIGFVMLRQGLGFPQAVELLESENGLRHLQAARPAPPAPKVEQREDQKKAEAVRRIWAQAIELEAGGIVDRYLRGRCLVTPVEYGISNATGNGGWPVDLRYHGALWHADLKRELPAMVAAMRKADGRLAAIHRTYLKVTGTAVTKAGTERDKMMLGDAAGTVIRLAAFADRMLGGEGIETSLSAMQHFKRAGIAFGSRANMAAVEPPFECSDFIYAADRNREHADPQKSRVGERAAWTGAKAFGVGRTMAVKVPGLPPGMTGDFNDALQLKARGEWPPAAVPLAPVVKLALPPAATAAARLGPLSTDRLRTARREHWEQAQDAKRAEEAAFKRYAAAGAALDATDPMDLLAHERAQLELDTATRAWKAACADRERLLKRTIA